MHPECLSPNRPPLSGANCARRQLAWLLVATLEFLVLVTGTTFAEVPNSSPPDFGREVRPILTENCSKCHGPSENEREAGLRLDIPGGPFEELDTGHPAVVPGQSSRSELFRRIVSRDESQQMPPPESGKSLTPSEIELVRRWIDGGAKWKTHWSFLPIERPLLPAIGSHQWPFSPIDYFSLARMEQEGLEPSAPATREQWLRRVTFDLSGVPPTLDEIDAFLSDNSVDAFERVVERLLQSPRYGERMTAHWLDLARYADTNGYHADNAREMWRWRDWVIEAFNGNMSFDQFTVEQIAGDLLPNPTLDQLIASGFNRNHMINFENGAFDEEYRAEYVADRVVTTSTVWLGLTMQCARCHDHKYDPVTTREFYGLFAYYNNVSEKGVDGKQGNAAPLIKAPTRLQQQTMDSLSQKLEKLEEPMQRRAVEKRTEQAMWEKELLAGAQVLSEAPSDELAHYTFDESEGSVAHDSSSSKQDGKVIGDSVWLRKGVGRSLLFTGNVYVDAGDSGKLGRKTPFTLSASVFPTTPDEMTVLARADAERGGYELALANRHLVLRLANKWPEEAIVVKSKTQLAQSKWRHIAVTYDGSGKASGIKVFFDGLPTAVEIERDSLAGDFARDVNLLIGRSTEATSFRGMIDDVRLYGRALSATNAAILAGGDPILAIVRAPAERRSQQQRQMLTKYYLENHDTEYNRLNFVREQLLRQRAELEEQVPTTMIMQDLPQPRATHVLKRGDYRALGEQVFPGTPSCLPPLPSNSPPNRLALAKWLVSPNNPLTARVVVNRLWQLHFGIGLVKTSEDFGTRGDFPSHPQLLDWLASEFIRSGWDVKRIQRLIVTSATYRQSSRVASEQLRRDPGNRLLARGPRKPLTAEFVRDQALLVSGLLVEQLGGPSVRPYQPAGLWREVSYRPGDLTAQEFVQDHGDDLYRRGMYTFWKRTVPPPSLDIFGAPDREVCTVRRNSSNTPFHSLVLLNDPTYVEAARLLAERIIRSTNNDQDRIEFGFRSVTSRDPTMSEVAVLLRILRKQRLKYRQDESAASELIQVGEHPASSTLDPAELASWTIVASTLINLHEALTN